MSELTLKGAINTMQTLADTAYVNYISGLRRDECLGAEIKMEKGLFGKAELEAHCKAAELLGRHRAFQESANMLSNITLNEKRDVEPETEET